jgi:hypothetical protein
MDAGRLAAAATATALNRERINATNTMYEIIPVVAV